MAINTSSNQKKNWIVWMIAIVLAITTFLVVKNKNPDDAKELEKADRGFTVASMNEVSKIVIKHSKLQPLIFTRNSGNWLLNGLYDVDPAVFVNIEKAITGMQLLYIPSKNATKTILESLKNNGIQVDIYGKDGEKPSKIFFVGTDTQKGDGTYMMLGGASQPYVMHLPGLAGGLRSRFEQPAINFRDKFIIKNEIASITSITLEYPGDYASSFKIFKNGDTWAIQPLLSKNTIVSAVPNPNMLRSYISRFEKLGAEMFVTDKSIIANIRKNLPSAILTIQNEGQKQRVYTFYGYEDINEDTGYSKTPVEIRNQNRLYIDVDSTDVMTAQNRVFSNIFLSYENFLGKIKN